MIVALATATFLDKAVETKTDALVVWEDGVEVVREGDTSRRMNVHSITKSMAALVVGDLVDEGAVSWDTPMSEVFPEEWADDPRGEITLDQVMTHASGLEPDRARVPWRPTHHALRSELLHEPGDEYAYSNNATNLLGGVVEATTGNTLEHEMYARVFDPLGIAGPRWTRHRGPTPAWSGLRMTADELLAVGIALLDEPAEQVTSPARGPHVGRLWWPVHIRQQRIQPEMVDLLVHNGLPIDEGEKLLALQDERYPTWGEVWDAVEEAEVDNAALATTGVQLVTTETFLAGYAARGWGGQYLVVLPEVRVVAVRQRKTNYQREQDPRVWGGFAQEVIEMLELRDEVTAGEPYRWVPG